MTSTEQKVPTEAIPAGQEPPTLGEKVGRAVDQVLGRPQAEADLDMRRVLSTLQSLGPQPIETLSASAARQQPTPADAVTALLRSDGKNPERLKAELAVTTTDVFYPTAGGPQPMRVYLPKGSEQSAAVIVYYHGGGWVIADLDTYDATPRMLAHDTGAIVFAPEYRHAPESSFPAQHDDAVSAYRWVLANASTYGGDAARVAVVGESAGANLAINVAIAARDRGLKPPLHQVLVYPVAGVDMNTPSYRENEHAKPLNKPMMAWFIAQVVESDADLRDARLDLVGKADLAQLPPATVITAGIDPLRSDGERLADKLRAAGVETEHRNYPGVTHEFFGMGAVVAEAKAAEDYVAQRLRAALVGEPSATPVSAVSASEAP